MCIVYLICRCVSGYAGLQNSSNKLHNWLNHFHFEVKRDMLEQTVVFRMRPKKESEVTSLLSRTYPGNSKSGIDDGNSFPVGILHPGGAFAAFA